MFRAVDKDGVMVFADEAEKGKEYFCPYCGEQLIFKQGEVVLSHFAHHPGSLCDEEDYENEMSAWHIAMQNQFSKENREIVIEYNGEKHRADVLIKGVVIEFQHSSISIEKFNNRTDFYLNAGYRIVWVFDMSNRFAKGQIFEQKKSNSGNKLCWNNALAIFDYYDAPQYWDRNMSVCFFRWEDFEWDGKNPYDCIDSEDKEGFIYKIQYVPIDSYSGTNWKYPRISQSCGINYTDMSSNMDVEEFFKTPRDYINKYVSAYKVPYKVIYHGAKGHNYNEYLCPITNEWANNECDSCTACIAILEYEQEGKMCEMKYCAYPNRVRKSNNEFGNVYVPTITENG